jgi:hypothetical protein
LRFHARRDTPGNFAGENGPKTHDPSFRPPHRGKTATHHKRQNETFRYQKEQKWLIALLKK